MEQFDDPLVKILLAAAAVSFLIATTDNMAVTGPTRERVRQHLLSRLSSCSSSSSMPLSAFGRRATPKVRSKR